jgi:hypothetical protein
MLLHGGMECALTLSQPQDGLFLQDQLVDKPIWIVTLIFSNNFDKVHWPALWRALETQTLSNHSIWILEFCTRTRMA